MITGAVGVATFTLSGAFDVGTGIGTQTIDACTGAALVCDSVAEDIGVPSAVDYSGTIASDGDGGYTWSEAAVVDTGVCLADTSASYHADAL